MPTFETHDGRAYHGSTALEIVERMRSEDFDAPSSVRDYIASVEKRTGISVPHREDEEEQAAEFLSSMARAGIATWNG